MSQVPFVKYIDPRLNLNQKQQYVSAESASLITTTLRSVNGDVGGSITINCNPPNRNICVSREVYKRVEFEVELEVKNLRTTPSTSLTLAPYTHAPAYMPVSRITLNEDITIGNANVNQANAPIVRETTSRFQDDSHFSGSANMNDTYLSFGDVDKSVRSALAPYFDKSTNAGTHGEVVSRNAFWNYDGNDVALATGIVQNASQLVKVKFTVEEPLMLSPFVFGKDAKNATALIGIESIQYNCSFGNYDKCFSFFKATDNTVDNSIQRVNSVKILNFGLRFTYLTPQPDYDIPRSMMYPYYEPQVRTEKVNTVASGADIDNNSLTVQLSGIPRRMYICMRDLDNTGAIPLRHLQLKEGTFSLKINGQNTLTGQTNKQLYDTASKNGYNLSYSQWEKYSGSIICLDFGKGDVSLLPLQVAGVNQKNEFEISASYKNQTKEEVKCQFTVIYIYDGVFRMVEGATNKLINTLTEKSVQDTKSITKLHIDHSPDNVYGGGMGGGLNLKGVSNDVANVVSKCVSENMGAGLENTGGRLMSRDMLRNRY